MKTVFSTVTVSLGVGVLGAIFATQASASCSYPEQKATPSPWQQPQPGQGHARFTPAVYRPGESIFTAFTLVGDEWIDNGSIIGLWEFEVHLNGAQNGLPDNSLFDWGLATWHDDGTEIQFPPVVLPAPEMSAWASGGRLGRPSSSSTILPWV